MVNVTGWPGAAVAGLTVLVTVSWLLTVSVADAAGLPRLPGLVTALAGMLLRYEPAALATTGTLMRQRRVAPVMPTTALFTVNDDAPGTALIVPLVPPPLVTQSITGAARPTTMPAGSVSVKLVMLSVLVVEALVM